MLQNTLIITLLFNSALPLLLPLAFIAFASAYAVDKVPTYLPTYLPTWSFINVGPCTFPTHND